MPEKHLVGNLNGHKAGHAGKLPMGDFEEPIIIGSSLGGVHAARKFSNKPGVPHRLNIHYHLGEASSHRQEQIEKELHEIEKNWEELDQEN